MNYFEKPPSGPLAAYVKCFWTLEYPNAQPVEPEPVIPDGCVEIIFNLSDRFRRFHSNGDVETQASSLLAGQMHSSVLIGPSGNVDLFGIRFHPAGAVRFMRFDMKDIAGRIDPLESVLGSSVRLIEEHLLHQTDFHGRVAIAESYLAGLMRSVSINSSPYIDHALAIISSTQGKISIRDITREVGISERSLERLFNRYVGTTPKAYSRIVRFQRVLREIEGIDSPDILDTALAFGYYDQSHLINDFNQYSGSSPSAFMERSRQMTDIFLPGE